MSTATSRFSLSGTISAVGEVSPSPDGTPGRRVTLDVHLAITDLELDHLVGRAVFVQDLDTVKALLRPPPASP